MKILKLLILIAILLWLASPSYAGCDVQATSTSPTYGTGFSLAGSNCDTSGAAFVNPGGQRGLAAGADTQIKTGPGWLHAISCWGSDAAATAGSIAVLDHTAAGGGTTILAYQIAAALLLPNTVILDVPFTAGLNIDFTTTNDVTCTVSYR